MPGSVAFVCAMPMELAPLRRKLALKPARVGSLDLYRGSVEGRPVVGIVTGMGGVLAGRGVARLCAAVEIERVVVVGIAGALAAEMVIGTLVVPEVVVDAASGVEYRPDRLGGGEPDGTMWTTQALIIEPDAIAALRQAGVVCLEMETAAIAQACTARNIPWSVVRAISDRATDGSLDAEVFGLINPDGSLRPGAIARYFLKHPGCVSPLVRFSRDARLAARRAAEAAVRAVTHRPGPGEQLPAP